ncbi:F0F1 ATP synthase subunit B [Williamsoniiplasma lucivorax]|uniref:ATP synthase subunit b n=1 Tax=Williamsoniiplasma lucivorax TaxID=209274 RepID=A0A2S5RET4_9MOLU|nr:F0F1 ATP synthase subunit B [Williamsoniiplasma lucivorax]PPE05839.1 F0F1 ATP synthase subunit B [Williamsoniiplasma lucivorax]
MVLINPILATTAGVPDVIGLLFPNIPNFIAHVLATIVIVLVLSKLVYKPFRKAVDARRAKINELLNEVVEKQIQANKDRKEAEQFLKDAKNESLTIIKNARLDANSQKADILESANIEATNLQNHAKSSIIREREKAQDEIKQTIIETAMSAASKILEENIDEEKNKKIVDDFIKNLK